MDTPKRYQNYLFDLYGTLADIQTDEDSGATWEPFSRFLALEGISISPGDLRAKFFHGVARMEAEALAQCPPGALPEVDLAPLFLSFYADAGVEAGLSQAAALARVFRALSLRRLRLFTGVVDTLRSLRQAGKRVFLLSNAQALFTRPELRFLGLEDAFDGVLLSSEAGRKKPDPAFFQMLMEKYGLDPAETVMVGNDDDADCRGAALAGLDSMYIRTEQSPPLSGPLPNGCRVLHSITEVSLGVFPAKLTVNGKEFRILKLLGKGKGGYSYLAADGQGQYVLKQIHHEPCEYYQFGDKLQAELHDYQRLRDIGIPIPRLLDADEKQERILKEYIAGETIFTLVKRGQVTQDHFAQMEAMCALLYPKGINIDYFPTNFVVRDGTLYYIDFECNDYLEEWDFRHWGVKYWSLTPEFEEYVRTHP